MSSSVAVITQLCDAVALELNKTSFAEPLNARRHNVPRFDRSKLDRLEVSVAPGSRSNGLQTRGGIKNVIYVVKLRLMKAIASYDEQESDPLLFLCEQIGEHFLTPPFHVTLDTGTRMAVTGSDQGDDQTPLLDVQRLDEKFEFKAVIDLTFMGIRR